MRNKVYTILTGILCFGVVAACEFPSMITVKSDPTVILPLGTIGGVFKNSTGDQGSFLTQLNKILDPAQLEVTLAKGTGQPFPGRIYRYTDDAASTGYHTGVPGGVQTYMITYPIQEMTQNLSLYMDQNFSAVAIEITSATATLSQLADTSSPVPILDPTNGSWTSSDPTIVIPLPPNIRTWTANIQLAKGTGIIFKHGVTALQNALELCIPQLGIGTVNSTTGVPTAYARGQTKQDLINYYGFSEGDFAHITDVAIDDLFFVDIAAPYNKLLNTTSGSIPAYESARLLSEQYDIQVYAQLVGPVSAGTLSPAVAFNWVSADFYPGVAGMGFDGGFPGFNLSSVLDQLRQFGEISLEEIPAYLYLREEGNYIGDLSSLRIEINYLPEGGALTPFTTVSTLPDHGKVIDDEFSSYFIKDLEHATVPSATGFDLKDLLDSPDNAALEYTIEFDAAAKFTIINDVSTWIKVKADLAIILPLRFAFMEVVTDGKSNVITGDDGNKYVPLNIPGLPDIETPVGGGEPETDAIQDAIGPNSTFSGLVNLDDVENEVTGDLCLGISEDRITWTRLALTPGNSATANISKPKLPAIKVLLKEDPALTASTGGTVAAAPFFIKPQVPGEDPALDFKINVGGTLGLDKTIEF
jgi:hypothetical protein